MMIAKIKSGKDFNKPSQLYYCESYDDILNIPRKTFGDRFFITDGANAGKSYIVNGNNEIVEVDNIDF